ncbi:MAG: protein-disulfide reductase DsbD family protein [Puniceicoccales bacterium]
MKKALTVVALALAFTTTATANPLSAMNAWVEGQLSASSGSVLAYAFLALGGLFASLLPCVYPLYPITASIVKGRAQEGGKRWPHPVTYYLGLASMYFCFGLIAGVTGGAFNEVLRYPMVNVGLSLLFLVLALATAGYLHLNFFGASQVGEKTPGLVGTFIMGMGAGLLSSSCVGPFVISILIGIASASDGFALMASLGAALKMLAFGLGLGVPFLIVGLFGAKLPRGGSWMRYVQIGLGMLIGWFSYVYLEKGLSGLGFESGAIQLIFFGAILLLFAVYRLQSKKSDEFHRMATAVYTLMAVVAFLALGRGILPSAGYVQGVPASVAGVSAGPAVQQKGKLTWFLDKEDAIAAAEESGKPIFVDFFGSWCANCKEFEKLTQSDATLNEALSNVVLLKVQDTDPEFKEWQSDSRFPELKVGLPFFVIMDASGNMIYKTSDYTRTDEMLLFLEG